MRVSNFWVDIEDASGTKYGPGPLLAQSFRVKRPLSTSGEFAFEVLAANPNISALAEKRVAICRYIGEAGTVQEFGGGVIDQISVQIGQDGLTVFAVSGNDLTRELGYRSVGSLALASGSAGVTNGPDLIMAYAPAGWTISGGTTSTPVYSGFDGESVLSAMCRVGEHIGEHWRLGTSREIEWLGPVSGFAAAGVRAVQHVHDPVGFESQTEIAVIESIEEIRDAADIVTRIIPRGSGNGGVALTLATSTDAAPVGYTLDKVNNYLKNDAAEALYGRIERVMDTKNIGPLSNTSADIEAASNALLQAAYQQLERYTAPQKAYSIGLWANSMLLPGTTIRVVYRVLIDGVVIYDLDDELIILAVEHSLDSTGLHTSALDVGIIDRMPMSDTDVMLAQVQNAKLYATHQQLSVSVDTLTFRDELDSSHSANLRFWLGDEYTSISRALLRFQIKPLRSTIKSVAGASTTTESGGSATVTSDTTAHLHSITLTNNIGGTPVQYGAGGLMVAGGGTDTVETESGHRHSVTIEGHTHVLTPVLTTTYGLFEEEAANTLGVDDLTITLNGGADLSGNVTDIGNGWYALDLSAYLVDSVYRPVTESNVVVLSTAVEKTGRVEAQITLRGVIQAINYS